MTGTPAERIGRFYRLMDSGDFAGLAAMFTPDATYHRPGCEPIAGRDGIESFYRERRIVAGGVHTVTKVVADGSDVAVTGAFRGVLKSGRAAEHRFAEFFEIAADGAFRRRDSFLFVGFAEKE